MVYVYVQRHFPCLSPFVGGCPHCCDSPACSIGPCLCLSDARPRRVQPHLGVLCNPTLACCATPPWRAVHSEAFYAANVHGGVDAEVFRRLLPEGSTDAEIAEMSARKVPPHA